MYLWNQGTPGSEVEYTLLKVGATWNQTFNGSLFICVKTGQAKNFENTSELFLTWKVLCFRSSHPEVFMKKVFWKYAANLQENTYAEVWFQ